MLFIGVRLLLKPHEYAIGNHNRVIHQHAEGDDERAERNPLHGDVINQHHT
ncbi:Uncharacterised protein [Vibrio cholerae]|uniref:Uncharacterized protein n=1 Tax=Vibrio cholerae TaxID=666 RepID=A0A656A0F4_VIBCL|nr:Uncharacterised protein [Vibrio cholerae]CSA88268.1 Uncharacterised protein [Vibrio cholerae]CSB25567.1 Uncharacterised protein [Vibrio cholerae]CSB83924.1 Uncharacterised protein [Vibrio cholerae]CSC17800.1 Uncharacterised protein [Vibrio cholerae]